MDEAPIPVALTPGDGGLFAYGEFENGAGTVPLLIDTGTVLTSRAVPSGARVAQQTLRVHAVAPGGGPGVPRAAFSDVPILETPLAQAGVGGDLFDLSTGGILAGDLLQGFSLQLDYGAGGPTIALLPGDLSCSCEVADRCEALLPFTLAGGGTFDLGDSVLTYPPTRVTVDACLEPLGDPLGHGHPCLTVGQNGQVAFDAVHYDLDGRPGTDVRMLVATGFPGLLLGASAWDRLHGAGSAAQLLAGPTVALHFPGRADPVPAARASLGDPANERAALALVDRLGLLGACGELARSRRLRAWAELPPNLQPIGLQPDCNLASSSCPAEGALSCLQCLNHALGSICNDARGTDRCNDANQPAAAYVELGGPIDVLVVDDAAPILQEVNFDVRPALSDVEGVVGTELLARLRARIDYPNGRILATCASSTGCATYPRFACPDTPESNDCGQGGQDSPRLCNPPSTLPAPAPVDGGAPPACLPAPIFRDGGA